MKKSLVSFAIASSIAASASAASPAVNTVTLYQQPNTSATVVEQVNCKRCLTPFHHQGYWIKVGDRRNGKVGWVQLPKPEKAIQPKFQTEYVQYSNNGKGQPQYEAYINGKKLNPKQTKVLLAHIRQQQQRWQQQFDRNQREINTVFRAEALQMRHMMASFPVVMPVLIVQNSAPLMKPLTQAKKTCNATKAKGQKQAQEQIHKSFNQMTGHVFNAKQAIQDYQQDKN